MFSNRCHNNFEWFSIDANAPVHRLMLWIYGTNLPIIFQSEFHSRNFVPFELPPPFFTCNRKKFDPKKISNKMFWTSIRSHELDYSYWCSHSSQLLRFIWFHSRIININCWLHLLLESVSRAQNGSYHDNGTSNRMTTACRLVTAHKTLRYASAKGERLISIIFGKFSPVCCTHIRISTCIERVLDVCSSAMCNCAAACRHGTRHWTSDCVEWIVQKPSVPVKIL